MLNRPLRWTALLTLTLTAAVAQPALAADEWVDRVNTVYADVRPDKRSDTELLPVLAKLEEPPKALTPDLADKMLPGMAQWAPAAAWAQRDPQKAAIETILKHAISDPKEAKVFAQPYGSAGVDADLIKADMFTDLGEPPMLAGARFGYLAKYRIAELLVNVEATRLVNDGKAPEALDLLLSWAVVCRELCDRQFTREAMAGYGGVLSAITRMRDIAYLDYKGKKSLGSIARDKLSEFIAKLDIETGVLRLPFLRPPLGERTAAEQLIASVYTPKAGLKADVFPALMARLGSSERPLRLFAESARWQSAAAQQRDWYGVTDELKRLYEDWNARWDLKWFDPRLADTPPLARTDRTSMAVITETVKPIDLFIPLRQMIRTEIVGTRSALGVLGFGLVQKGWPSNIALVRPVWVKALDADPFYNGREVGAATFPQFFVPVRDQARGEREEPKPFRMNVSFKSGGSAPFEFREDTFILYSLGKDATRDRAVRVDNRINAPAGTDYLYWPPLESLEREHLIKTGKLK